ncbi:MAG: radical SAM protein [Patescibacteria group bacterium]
MLTLLELRNQAAQLLLEVQKLLSMKVNELAALIPKRKLERQYFAPIYASNVCGASCPYCAFHKGSGVRRITLTFEQALQEALFLKGKGCDSAYCLTGSFPEKDIAKVGSMTEVNARVLRAIHQVGLFPVLESSPFSRDNLAALLESAGGRGRYVLFMEAYNQDVYRALHDNDPYKGNPEKRLQQVELALEAGWQEVGIGFLIGLNPNITEEVTSLVAHYRYLREERGVHTVTLSVPRVNPGTGVEATQWTIPDEMFTKVVFVLQILCPDAWIVLTGRESAALRDRLIPLINQCIIGVCGSTVPGGYTLGNDAQDGQFALLDRRSIKELRYKYN